MAAVQRQWIPLQKKLQPRVKDTGSQYQRNARRRHKEAVESALKKGYLKCLDRELILGSQLEGEGVEDLEDVLRISLKGCHVQAIDDIAILSCARLRICNLESCYISDISAFHGCVNLLKLDVSNNQIDQLPPHDLWASLSSLQVLYLNGNAVSGREGLRRLNGCPKLHVLTLHETPLSLMKNYRHHVVNSILSLRALDYHVISDEEIIENFHLKHDTFAPLTHHFRLQLHRHCTKGAAYQGELCGVYSLLLAVDQVLARHSPVIIIQRWVRGWLVRKALARNPNPKIRSIVKRQSGSSTIFKLRVKKAVPQDNLHKPNSITSAAKKRITTRVPTSAQPTTPSKSRERNLSIRKSHSNTYTITTLPPPPPTSPRISPLPIETHIVDLDAGSSKMKMTYTMHINLDKLQHKVTDAEPKGVTKAFQSAFRHKRKSSMKGRMAKQLGPRKGECETETSPKPQALPKAANVPASDSSRKSLNANDAELSDGADEKVEEKLGDSMEVTGQSVKAVPCNHVEDMVTSRKEDGRRVRIAEKEIKKTVRRANEPPPKSCNVKPSTVMSKDEMTFTRAYATMTLSALRAVEKVHEARKKADLLIQRANLVAKMKHERMERREKIEKFHKEVRENIMMWRIMEENRLDCMQEQLLANKSEEVLRRVHSHDTAMATIQQHREDEKFAHEFGQQNTLVRNMVCKEDQKVLKDESFQEARERVGWTREVSYEHQEMVRRYMEQRDAKLLQEAATARKDLDAKMLQAASQRMVEAKKRVAREVARKQAARAAIATAKDNLKSGPHLHSHPPVYHESHLPSQQGEGSGADCTVVLHDKLNPLRTVKKQAFRSPVNARKMSCQAHRTWQRGCQVLMRERHGLHFPILAATTESPLMYDMMRPRPMFHGCANTPGSSSLRTESRTDSSHGLNSPTSSALLQQKQLVVR